MLRKRWCERCLKSSCKNVFNVPRLLVARKCPAPRYTRRTWQGKWLENFWKSIQVSNAYSSCRGVHCFCLVGTRCVSHFYSRSRTVCFAECATRDVAEITERDLKHQISALHFVRNWVEKWKPERIK